MIFKKVIAKHFNIVLSQWVFIPNKACGEQSISKHCRHCVYTVQVKASCLMVSLPQLFGFPLFSLLYGFVQAITHLTTELKIHMNAKLYNNIPVIMRILLEKYQSGLIFNKSTYRIVLLFPINNYLLKNDTVVLFSIYNSFFFYLE